MEDSKEYELLRNEMMNTYTRIQNDFSIYTSIIIAILTLTLKIEIKYLLLPCLLILPLYFEIEARHDSVARLGAYLYVFHEGKEFNWERRHHYFDEKGYNKWSGKIDRKKFNLFYTLVASCGMAAEYKCYENYWVSKNCLERKILKMYTLFNLDIGYHNFEKIVLLFEIILIIISILLIFHIMNKTKADYVKLRNSYIYKWQTIKIVSDETKNLFNE